MVRCVIFCRNGKIDALVTRPETDITPQESARNPVEANAPCLFPWTDPTSGYEYQGCLTDFWESWCPIKWKEGEFAGRETNYYGICSRGIVFVKFAYQSFVTGNQLCYVDCLHSDYVHHSDWDVVREDKEEVVWAGFEWFNFDEDIGTQFGLEDENVEFVFLDGACVPPEKIYGILVITLTNCDIAE